MWWNKQGKLKREALGIVERTPGGIGYAELIDRLIERHPHQRRDEIRSFVSRLDEEFAGRLFRLPGGTLVSQKEFTLAYAKAATDSEGDEPLREHQFYGLCRDHVLHTLRIADRCVVTAQLNPTVAGNGPDLLGIQYDHDAPVPFALKELIAFELKASGSAEAVKRALWQALSYRVFAHRAFVVMPTPGSLTHREVLEARCYHHGIGLIYFDVNPVQPNFHLRYPSRSEVPHLAMTRMVKAELRKQLPSEYEALFAQ